MHFQPAPPPISNLVLTGRSRDGDHERMSVRCVRFWLCLFVSMLASCGPSHSNSEASSETDSDPTSGTSSGGGDTTAGGCDATPDFGGFSGPELLLDLSMLPSPSWAGGPLLAVGDLNGDGNLDLAATEYVAYGRGDGSFGAPFLVHNSGRIGVVRVGRINGDAIDDLVLAEMEFNSDMPLQSTGEVGVRLGAPDFADGPTDEVYAAPAVLHSIGLGEFDGDGLADIVAAFVPAPDVGGMYDLSISFSASDRTVFQRIGRTDGPYLKTVDFDHDGDDDLVAGSKFFENQDAQLSETQMQVSWRAAFGSDVNCDGMSDAIDAEQGMGLRVWPGTASGYEPEPENVASLPVDRILGVGRFNDDGAPDIALVSAGRIMILLNDGTGSFSTSDVGAAPDWTQWLIADVNGDRLNDLVGHDGQQVFALRSQN